MVNLCAVLRKLLMIYTVGGITQKISNQLSFRIQQVYMHTLVETLNSVVQVKIT